MQARFVDQPPASGGMRTDVYDGPLSGHREVLAIVAAGKSVEEKPPEKLVNLISPIDSSRWFTNAMEEVDSVDCSIGLDTSDTGSASGCFTC